MVQLAFPAKIYTDRLILQPLRYEDAEEIFYAYASKLQATRYVSWPMHKSTNDTRRFLEYAKTARSQHRDYSFSIRLKESYRLIGSFGFINNEGEIQFGYIVSPSQWNKGYATEACRTMIPLVTQQPGVIKLSTFVAAENTASSRVLLKSGLIEEHRKPNWYVFPNCNPNALDCILYTYPLHPKKIEI
jgi:[ribosomal protein S5]-alanine N-acetyltransferase